MAQKIYSSSSFIVSSEIVKMTRALNYSLQKLKPVPISLDKLELTHSVDLVDNKEIYKCNQCELETFSWDYMKNHTFDRHLSEGRLNKCDICDKTFAFRISLKTHKRDVHDAVPTKCKDCDFVAMNMGKLKYHIIGIITLLKKFHVTSAFLSAQLKLS